VNGFQTYKMYVALKNHFTSSTYDYFRYNGKTRASIRTYEARKDKYFFEKLARKRDVQDLILANIIEQGPSVWVGDLANEQQAEENYRRWVKRQQSITYAFTNELDKLELPYDQNIIVTDGQHPPLLKHVIQENISIETLIILNDLCSFTRHWNRKIEEKVIWPPLYNKCKKYRPFVKFDREKLKQIVIDKFS
jgi:T4 gene Gp59 loader of gp41 DNA helicase/T4 gene Gp59 loader of gp41 DNA helicase C-term